MNFTDSQIDRISELTEEVRECIKERIEKEKALGIQRERKTTYDDYSIIRRGLLGEVERQKKKIAELDTELNDWQRSMPVATPENVEAIKRLVRTDREESGLYATLKGVDYITSNAGTKNERLFTESQIKEIFREVTGDR